MADRSLEALLHNLRGVARRSTNLWTTGFAKSILAQAKNSTWRPSAKQLGTIRLVVKETITSTEVDDMPLIEDGGHGR